MRKTLGLSLSLILINIAAILEKTDEKLLPSVYKEVSDCFGIGPTSLGYLTFTRTFVQAISSPLAGILVLNYDRPKVLAMGTILWALSTAGVGASQYFWQVAAWRALNGFGLAIVIPTIQSFVADSFRVDSRGAGFGVLGMVGAIGGTIGAALATVVAGNEFLGIPGWRCAFVGVSGFSLLAGVLVYAFVVDPRTMQRGVDGTCLVPERLALLGKVKAVQSSIWSDSLDTMKVVVKVNTFRVIVLQGIVGSFPWAAIVFFTLWFELIGFSNNAAATLVSIFSIGGALGSLLGGLIGDKMSRFRPNTGRIMCAQFSSFMSIPFSWFLLKHIPQTTTSWNVYAITLFFMGITISWCGAATNNPIFAEVVPLRHRTMIYAFDRALEGTFSSFAAPIVGALTENFFKYNSETFHSRSTEEAYALSRGLFVLTAYPWGICCLCYSLLYFYYKTDKENASLKEQDELICEALPCLLT